MRVDDDNEDAEEVNVEAEERACRSDEAKEEAEERVRELEEPVGEADLRERDSYLDLGACCTAKAR